MNKKNTPPSYFEKTFGKKVNAAEKGFSEEKETRGKDEKAKKNFVPKGKKFDPALKKDGDKGFAKKPKKFEPKGKFESKENEKPFIKKNHFPNQKPETQASSVPVLAADEKMPLNKYIAHCGLCSRRDAVMYIKQGKVKVNEILVAEPGHKIEQGDVVSVSGKKIVPQKNLTYILLNKPKGFITTTDDEKDRKTIMDLVSVSEELRLYPVGRLDRATTGLILLTNDGDLAQKLSHPKYRIKKIYHVTLDKNITNADIEKIAAGLLLEDGLIHVDSVSILENKNELGIEIHSGKNRIVRRIFEHLGYVVEKLDRVSYAGLTKKNLQRGKWRELTPYEIVLLKHFKS